MRLSKFVAVVTIVFVGPCLMGWKTAGQDAPAQRFVGKWVMTVSGQTFLILSLKITDGRLTGVMTRPDHFQIDASGNIVKMSAKSREIWLVQAVGTNGHLELLEQAEKDPERFELIFVDLSNILLQDTGAPIPPWKLKRLNDNEDIKIASHLSVDAPKSKEITALQQELRRMAAEDQAARTANPVSMKQMRLVDQRHYPRLLQIYEKYGWPTFSLVGKEAAHDYWLLVQHQRLDFQKMVLSDMERATAKGEASKAEFAQLYDRVMVYEGKPQRWGTQAKCQKGKAVLYEVDDPVNLDQRRAEMNLWPLKDYLPTLCHATQVTKKERN